MFIYHEGTGTVIPLSDDVYLVDEEAIPDEMVQHMSEGYTVYPNEHKGYRLDDLLDDSGITSVLNGGTMTL